MISADGSLHPPIFLAKDQPILAKNCSKAWKQKMQSISSIILREAIQRRISWSDKYTAHTTESVQHTAEQLRIRLIIPTSVTDVFQLHDRRVFMVIQWHPLYVRTKSSPITWHTQRPEQRIFFFCLFVFEMLEKNWKKRYNHSLDVRRPRMKWQNSAKLRQWFQSIR